MQENVTFASGLSGICAMQVQTLVLILRLSGFHWQFFHSTILFQFTPVEFCLEFIGVTTNPGNSNAELN